MNNTAPLQEQIEAALIRATEDGADRTEHYAAAVLPIIAAEVRKAQADAWDGCADVAGDEMGVGGVPHAVKLRRCNPYRADQIETEDQT